MRRKTDALQTFIPTDIMDGHFVPNIVMGAPVIASVHKALPDIFMDCHMMVADPGKVSPALLLLLLLLLLARPDLEQTGLTLCVSQWVKDISEAGGASYTFHLEATDDPMDVVRQIKATKMRAAVAINPGTPASEISDELGNAVDMILVMTVWPGAGGQKFMKECMPKVAELRARFPEQNVEVDGGVGPKTIDRCADAGANVIVAGTAVFNHPNPKDVIHFLRTRCEEAQERIKKERERIARGEPLESSNTDGRRSAFASGAVTPLSHPRVYMSSAKLQKLRRESQGALERGDRPSLASLSLTPAEK